MPAVKEITNILLTVLLIFATGLNAQEERQLSHIFTGYVSGHTDSVLTALGYTGESDRLTDISSTAGFPMENSRPTNLRHQESDHPLQSFSATTSGKRQTANLKWQQKFGSNALPAADIAGDVVGLSNGYVVVGSSDGGESGVDMITARYSQSGELIWRQQWGTASRIDKAIKASTDAAGNILVCGVSSDGAGESRLVIINYDLSGRLLWSETWLPETAIEAFPVDVVETDDGHISICGTLQFAEMGKLFLLKISDIGVLQWSAQYDNPVGKAVHVSAMTIGREGSLILTGYRANSLYMADLMVLNYNLHGELQWQFIREAQGNNFGVSVATDHRDQIYVAGFGETEIPGYANSVVLAIDHDGNMIWERLLDHSRLTIAQEIFVAGESLQIAGYLRDPDLASRPFTARYSLEGDREYIKSPGLPGALSATPHHYAFDDDGSCYFTATLKLPGNQPAVAAGRISSSGELVWSRRRKFIADQPIVPAAIDVTGGLYIAASTYGDHDWDYLGLAFDQDGILLGESLFNGDNKSIDATEVVQVDYAGDIIVAANSYRGAGRWQPILLKYSPAGKLLWAWESANNDWQSEFARDVLIDHENGIWVAGYVQGWQTSRNISLRKISTNGRLLMHRVFEKEGYQTPVKLRPGYDGHIQLAGTYVQQNGNVDCLLLNIDREGMLVWEYLFDTPGPGNDFVRDFAVDSEGNSTLVGYQTTYRNQTDIMVFQLDREGQLRWQKQLNGTGNGIDQANAVVADVTGNIYIAATLTELNDLPSAAVYKFSRDGDQLMLLNESRTQKSYDQGMTIAIAPERGFYLAGVSFEPGMNREVFVNYYALNGERFWRVADPVDPAEVPQIRSMFLSASGNLKMLYTHGSASGASGSTIFGLDHAGQTVWRTKTPAGNQPRITWAAMTENEIGQPIAVGSTGSVHWQKVLVSSFCLPNKEVTVDVDHRADPIDLGKSLPYPNPFNPQTHFTVNLQNRQNVRLAIFNIIGQRVAQIVNSDYPAGRHEITWDARDYASGVYFYQLQVGSRTAAGRLLLTR